MGSNILGKYHIVQQLNKTWGLYMGGWQNYVPFRGTLNIRCRIIIGIQEKTRILATSQMYLTLNPKPFLGFHTNLEAPGPLPLGT